jgi:hypothetical protein
VTNAEFAEGGERDLPVDRREEAASAGEVGELLADNFGLFEAGRGVGVALRVTRDGGIDVETVDRRIVRDAGVLLRERAVGVDAGDGCGLLSGVVSVRAAEPVGGLGIVERRHGGDGGGEGGVCRIERRSGHGRRFLSACGEREGRQSGGQEVATHGRLLSRALATLV